MSDVVPTGDPRVFLAIERTFLAWTRTALALMGFGFVVARLGLFLREFALDSMQAAGGAPPAGFPGSLVLGCGLILAGVSVQAASMVEHRRRVRRFRAGESIAPMQDVIAVAVGICIIAAGIVGFVYLFSTASR